MELEADQTNRRKTIAARTVLHYNEWTHLRNTSEWNRLKPTAALLSVCIFDDQDVNVHCAECHLILIKSVS